VRLLRLTKVSLATTEKGVILSTFTFCHCEHLKGARQSLRLNSKPHNPIPKLPLQKAKVKMKNDRAKFKNEFQARVYDSHWM